MFLNPSVSGRSPSRSRAWVGSASPPLQTHEGMESPRTEGAIVLIDNTIFVGGSSSNQAPGSKRPGKQKETARLIRGYKNPTLIFTSPFAPPPLPQPSSTPLQSYICNLLLSAAGQLNFVCFYRPLFPPICQ